jgi:hypothetical protein
MRIWPSEYGEILGVKGKCADLLMCREARNKAVFMVHGLVRHVRIFAKSD